MVRIPPDTLSIEALRGVIEAFVLREGTDYGPVEHALGEKCLAVERELRAGRAEICFDPVSGSTDIRVVDRNDDSRRSGPEPAQAGR